MNVGVIGVGNMGYNHARILSQMKGVDNVYVYDANISRAKEVARTHQCKSCESLETLYSNVDAVTIAVPTKLHCKIAEETLEHGLHTLVEKPITKTVEEAEMLCNVAKAFPDLVTGVGHIERFNPVCTIIRENIKQPKFIQFMRHNPGSNRITDTHVVEDLMIHDIDLANWITNGEFLNVVISAFGNSDVFVAMLHNKYPLVMTASRAATKKTRQIYVEDENYTMVGDLVDQSLLIYRPPEKYTMMVEDSKIGRINLQRIEPLQHELAMFIGCIEQKEKFPITFNHGLTNLRICNAIISCSIDGKVEDRKC